MPNTKGNVPETSSNAGSKIIPEVDDVITSMRTISVFTFRMKLEKVKKEKPALYLEFAEFFGVT